MFATPVTYHIMQRSSSCEEPRHPLVSLGYLFSHYYNIFFVYGFL